MLSSRPLPNLAVVTALTPGGPYRVGDAISLAFCEPTVGRLVAHVERDLKPTDAGETLVPETISVRVVRAAAPYDLDTILMLSFIDPSVARIHPQTLAQSPMFQSNSTISERPRPQPEPAPPALDVGCAANASRDTIGDREEFQTHARATLEMGSQTKESMFANRAIMRSRDTDAVDVADRAASFHPEIGSNERVRSDAAWESSSTANRASEGERRDGLAPVLKSTFDDVRSEDPGTVSEARSAAVRVSLQWTPARVRRFVTVVDKLFTVERLGWYRHVLATRLLVPDRIECGDASRELEAMRHLHALRAASLETLGRPLVNAFMPNFTITPEWLESIESAAAARAVAGLYTAVEPILYDASGICEPDLDDTWTTRWIDRDDLTQEHAASVEAFLPVLVANTSTHDALTECLTTYRRALVDVFAQTSRSAGAVRLGAMTQPNHVLDDRLWQLVGTVGETFGGLAVA